MAFILLVLIKVKDIIPLAQITAHLISIGLNKAKAKAKAKEGEEEEEEVDNDMDDW